MEILGQTLNSGTEHWRGLHKIPNDLAPTDCCNVRQAARKRRLLLRNLCQLRKIPIATRAVGYAFKERDDFRGLQIFRRSWPEFPLLVPDALILAGDFGSLRLNMASRLTTLIREPVETVSVTVHSVTLFE
jgi:hypothetical protein